MCINKIGNLTAKDSLSSMNFLTCVPAEGPKFRRDDPSSVQTEDSVNKIMASTQA